MTRFRAEEVETARARTRAEAGALCSALATVLPLLRELRPVLVEFGKSATFLPGWLVGGLVGTIADGLIGGLEDWQQQRCG